MAAYLALLQLDGRRRLRRERIFRDRLNPLELSDEEIIDKSPGQGKYNAPM